MANCVIMKGKHPDRQGKPSRHSTPSKQRPQRGSFDVPDVYKRKSLVAAHSMLCKLLQYSRDPATTPTKKSEILLEANKRAIMLRVLSKSIGQ